MEIVTVKNEKTGDWDLYAKCSIHDWFYKGEPPLTIGCAECWQCYFFMNGALAGTNLEESTDLLEAAIHHLIEHENEGTWDFKPQFKVDIEKDKEN